MAVLRNSREQDRPQLQRQPLHHQQLPSHSLPRTESFKRNSLPEEHQPQTDDHQYGKWPKISSQGQPGKSIEIHQRSQRLFVGHRRSRRNDALLISIILFLALAGSNYAAPLSTGSSQAVGESGRTAGSGEVAVKDSNWLKGYEPSCDELRAMWRFSKRQSRAAEITNEIPTYRTDPFAMNLWQPQPNQPINSKQVMKGRMGPNRYVYDRSGKLMRSPSRNGFPLGPVYGRVVHKQPELDFGYPVVQPSPQLQQQQQMPRRVQYRFPGPSPPANAVFTRMSGSTPQNVTPQRGSFMKLKELVWTERARELAHQRRTEEMQARAAVLKELANGGHGMSYQQANQFNNQDAYYSGAGGGGSSSSDYNGGAGLEDESSYYDGGAGSKLGSHFRERNSFLQQQQQQQQQPANMNGKINFPSKHSRLY